MSKPSSRLLVVATMLVIGVFGGAGAHAAPPTDQRSAVQALLDSPAARYLTPQALLSLRAMANPDHALGADPSFDQGSPQAASRPEAAPGAAPESAGLRNVRVNNPGEDTHQTDQTTQSETSIAAAGSRVVVGFNDSQRSLPAITAGTDFAGYAFSTDGGESFTDGGAVPNRAGCANFGDPWLGVDRKQTVYYSTLMSCTKPNAGLVGVARSTDGGRTFSAPTPLVPDSLGPFYFSDKPALTAGPDPQNADRDVLYDAFDDFSSDSPFAPPLNGLAVARSTDGGQHWTVGYAAKVPLAQPCANGQGAALTQYIGAQPFVNPATGTLLVASQKIVQPCAVGNGGGGGSPPPVQFSEVAFTSKDGGQHFGSEVKISDVVASFPTGLLELAPGRVMRNAEFPSVAMLGSDLVVAWNDGRSGHSHVLLSRSADGAQWSAPVGVTSGGGDELQPAISSAGKRLDVLYYARNADNTLDVHLARSTDGATFTTRRVTDRSFPGALTFPQSDPVIAQTYMGDYIANVASGEHRYFAWGDNRDTVRSFLYPDGRPDPDVFAARS